MSSTFDAESAGNAQEVEMQFAVKTVEHLEVGTMSQPPDVGVDLTR